MVWRLAFVQMLFTLSWTVYVIFLPALFRRAGIDANILPWVLIADQLIFAAMDFGLGLWLDRAKAALEKFSNWFMVVVGLACLLFISLPWLSDNAPQGVLIFAVILWVVCSSVLRVPPLYFMAKAVAVNETNQTAGKPLALGVAAYFFGIGVAGAAAPFLTITLKNIDPTLPFFVASASLMLATYALRPMLKLTPENGANPTLVPVRTIDFKLALPMLVAVALFAFGVQMHVAFNSAKYFTSVYPGASLEWLMPLFWVGFSVAMFPASQWLKRCAYAEDLLAQIAGATQAMWCAGLLGAAALVACVFAPTLALLIIFQVVAGAAWAVVMLAVFSAVSAMGKASAPIKIGLWLGAALALMALATVGRIWLVLLLSSNPNLAEFKQMLPSATAVSWLAAAALALLFARVMRREQATV